MNKVYWMDDTDWLGVQEKLATGRQKYADREWIRFRDDLYEKPEDAYRAFIAAICMKSMFSSGKVVYCFGMPLKKNSGDYHSKIAKEFDRMPESNSLIIIARPDRGSTLYKAVKALETEQKGKAEEPLELSKSNAVDWISDQAEKMKLRIEKPACMALADMTNFSPPKIQQELIKLGTLSSDGEISIRLIEMAGSGEGAVDVKELAQFILKNDKENAHEYMQRLFDRGEPAIKICGYLQDWINRLAFADGANCNFEKLRPIVSDLKKWEYSKLKDQFGLARYETVCFDKWGKFSRREGETIPMFSNPNSIWYSCKELRESGRVQDWAIESLGKIARLQNRLRQGEDEIKVMHEFVADLMQ